MWFMVTDVMLNFVSNVYLEKLLILEKLEKLVLVQSQNGQMKTNFHHLTFVPPRSLRRCAETIPSMGNIAVNPCQCFALAHLRYGETQSSKWDRFLSALTSHKNPGFLHSARSANVFVVQWSESLSLQTVG